MKRSVKYTLLSICSILVVLLVTQFNVIPSINASVDKNSLVANENIESTKINSKEEAIKFLTPQFQKSLKEAVDATVNVPEDFVGFPATCFAPDTSKEVIDNFYKNRTAVANSLGIVDDGQDSRYNLVNRWNSTATNGGGLGQGDITTLTWSYVPDGTPITPGGCGVSGESSDNSNFIAFFNGIYGGPTVAGDYTTAPWHAIFVNMFASWSNTSGLIFVYEPNDDGVTVATSGGVLNTRGDMRISGHSVDGNSNVLACNFFPQVGDMIIDTADNFYANSPGVGTTNVLTHEIGHGLGIAHVCPIEQTKLMEPFVTTAFVGPQEDDILATNRNYGDPDGNNDTTGNATFLGVAGASSTFSVSQRSIDDNSDIDYFSFTVGSASVLTVTLTPTGTTYLESTQNNATGNCNPGTNFNALTIADLQFEVLDINGTTVIATGNDNGPGVVESQGAIGLTNPGTYFVRVRQQGASINNVQMYDLDVSLTGGTVLDNDVAATAITQPEEFESGLSNAEQLEISLSNFGALDQSNIPYQVSINGAVVANETYAPNLTSGSSVSITVPGTFDLSALGYYDICVSTQLVNDENTDNDEVCKTVLNNCIPSTTTAGATACSSDGIKQFVLGTINVDDGGAGCNTDPDPGTPVGYSNRTDLITDLDRRAGFNTHTLQASTRWNDERIKVWIDFNENGVFTDAGEEVLNQTFTITDGTLESFTITIPTATSLGNKLLRARAFDASADPSTTGPCDDIVYGETQDYTVNIVDPTATCSGAVITWDGSQWIGGIAPGIVDTAIINGSYNTGNNGSIEACELIINTNRTLTVTANSYVRIQNDITVDGILLVNHQGSVVQVKDDATTINNGTINVSAETLALKPRDFVAFGSPMSNVTREGDLAPVHRVFRHITANFMAYPGISGFNFLDDNFDNHVQHTGVLNPGEGYFMRPRPINATGNEVYAETFTAGTLNSGDIDFAVGYNGSQGDSYNLLANPYPSAIDARDFIMDNSMVNEIFLWEHIITPSTTFPGANTSNHSMENISMFNMTGPTTAAGATQPNNGYLSTAQGFGILATAAGTATFTNDMRLTDNNNTLRSVEEQMDRLWLKISNNTYDYHNTTLIGFTNEATDGLDAGYDSGRMATVVALYSHLDDASEQLAIQGRSAFTIDTQVKVGYATVIDEEQTYTIAIEDIQGPNITNEQVYLVDKLLGTITNLSETSYVFTSSKAEVNDRFIVQFTDRNVLATNVNALDAITVYPNPTNGIVNVNAPQAIVTGVTITDIQGRVISVIKDIEQRSVIVDLTTKQSGIYFVNIQTEYGSKIERIIKK